MTRRYEFTLDGVVQEPIEADGWAPDPEDEATAIFRIVAMRDGRRADQELRIKIDPGSIVRLD